MILTLLISFIVVTSFLAITLVAPSSKAVPFFGVLGGFVLAYLLVSFTAYLF